MKYRIRTALLAVLLAFLCVSHAVTESGTPGGKTRTFLGGRVSVQQNIPVLVLSGSYYEMGLQYGTLMKKELNVSYRKLVEFRDAYISSLAWYKRMFSGLALRWAMSGLDKRVPAKYLDELKGLSEGSGIPLKELLFMAHGAGIFSAMCTSLVSKADGRLLHARNFDFAPYFMAEHPVIVEYNPPSGRRYVNIGVLGYPGAFNGMNDAGLTASLNLAFHLSNEDDNGVAMGFKIREIMERAETLDQAEAIMREFKKTDESGWILTIASAREKNGIMLDVFHGVIVRTDLGAKKQMIVFNQIFHKDRLGSPENSKKFLDAEVGANDFNVSRQKSAKKFLAKRSFRKVSDILDFLSDRSYYGYRDMVETGNASINNEFTLQTLVFDASKRTFYFSSAPGFSAAAPMVKYDFDKKMLKPYRKALTYYTDPGFKKRLDWFNRAQLVLVGRDGKSLAKMITPGMAWEPRQAEAIFEIWKDERSMLPAERMRRGLEDMAGRYPDHYLPRFLLGRFFEEQGLRREAAAQYEKALAAPLLFDDDAVKIRYALYRTNKKLGQKEAAKKHAKAGAGLVQSLSKEFRISDAMKDMEKEMRKYAD